MSAWIWAFLQYRRPAVEVNVARGDERPFRAGLPQGSVLAPTLYTLWLADLITALKTVPGTDIFMYADDTATLSSGASIAEAGHRAQRTAQRAHHLQLGNKMEDAVRRRENAGPRPVSIGPRRAEREHQGVWRRGDCSPFPRTPGRDLRSPPSRRRPLCRAGKKVRPRVAQLRRMTGRSWGLGER